MIASTNIFKNASVKLTAFYLCIIIFISLLFSVGIYDVSSDELRRTINRPLTVQQRIRIGVEGNLQLNELRQEELTKATRNLRGKLVAINLIIFMTGGAISYYLARRTLKPIEEAHEAQSRFTADAAHELRTPITAMRTETEVTLMDDKLSVKEARKQLESNLEELDKLTGLTDGLLQLSRLSSDNLETSAIDIKETVLLTSDRVEKQLKAKNQTLRTKLAKRKTVVANQPLLVEALVTLLDNASKYSAEGSEIVLLAKDKNKCIEFSVVDTGIGISGKDLPRIFDRFYQADSSRTDTDEGGHGIGLSIAKSIIEAHGGTITAQSNINEGTTITLSIPS